MIMSASPRTFVEAGLFHYVVTKTVMYVYNDQ